MSIVIILTADRKADILMAYEELKSEFSEGTIVHYLSELKSKFLHLVNLINFVKEEVRKVVENNTKLLIVTHSEEAFIGIRYVINEYKYSGVDLYFATEK